MTRYDLVLRGRRVVTPRGEVPACVGIRDGRIATVAPGDARLAATDVVELADDEVLLPGLVDCHVHVNDPGRADWEGFESATRAAAAGGITTIIDMPLNSLPPTIDVAALRAKRRAAADHIHVDVGFWGGAVPENLAELPALHAAGVFGFKAFLSPSGVDEFGHLDEDRLAATLDVLAGLDALLLVHAEDPDTLAHAPVPDGRRYADFLASRPDQAEVLAIARVLELTRRHRARSHIVHVSSSAALPLIQAARASGVRISAETCPHYLSFAAEEIPDGATEFKCCPPIRGAANRHGLWRGLRDGTIDCVVSDHSPCPTALKRFDIGDFGLAWGGVASLQLSLPAVWTQARSRGHTLPEVVRWMAGRPAELIGASRKGRIEVGCDGDFAVFAPEDTFVVDTRLLHHRNPVSAYQGRTLAGVVRRTWLRGRPVTGDRPDGTFLTRGGQ